MKFLGKGTVWDASNNRILCRFIEGTYETTDEREIEILSQRYRIDPESMTKQELLKVVEDGKAQMSKAELLEKYNEQSTTD